MKPTLFTAWQTFLRPGRRLIAWILGVAGLVLAGCASNLATPTSSHSAPALVIAVQIPGGARPTSQQVAMIYQALSTNPTLVGYRFVDRTADADYVLVAVFTPDALDPNQGNISVKEIAPASKLPTQAIRSPTEMISSAQESQQQLEAWARNRESVMPRP